MLSNLCGRKYRFRDRWGESLFKEAYAFIPQSTVADIVNRHGLNYIHYNQDLFAPVELLAQVHDSLVFQIPKAIEVETHAKILHTICINLEQPLEWKGRTFVIPAEVSIHDKNLKDGKELGRIAHLSSAKVLTKLMSDF